MATATPAVEESPEVELDIDLPDNRVYDNTADAELDKALVEAIEKADRAGNSFLVKLLSRELGSHYYETR